MTSNSLKLAQVSKLHSVMTVETIPKRESFACFPRGLRKEAPSSHENEVIELTKEFPC